MTPVTKFSKVVVTGNFPCHGEKNTDPSTMPFLKIFFQFEQNFDIFRPQSFRSFDQALTSPSGVQRRIYTTSAEREFDGVGWGGVGRNIKSVL